MAGWPPRAIFVQHINYKLVNFTYIKKTNPSLHEVKVVTLGCSKDYVAVIFFFFVLTALHDTWIFCFFGHTAITSRLFLIISQAARKNLLCSLSRSFARIHSIGATWKSGTHPCSSILGDFCCGDSFCLNVLTQSCCLAVVQLRFSPHTSKL